VITFLGQDRPGKQVTVQLLNFWASGRRNHTERLNNSSCINFIRRYWTKEPVPRGKTLLMRFAKCLLKHGPTHVVAYGSWCYEARVGTPRPHLLIGQTV
jgi:hypothetical protein